MGKLQQMYIQYGNPQAVYVSGQQVTGRVVIVLNEPMDMRGVRLEMKGYAYTHWTAAGTHTFDFAFLLPPNLATSFEGSAYGYIRYHCKAVIDKAWKFDDTVKAPFTVLSMVDLNYHPSAALPVQMTRGKELGCGCCASGTLTANVVLDRQGFVPGEQMGVKIEVQNNSTRSVEHVRVELEQVATFHASRNLHVGGFTHTRQTKNTVARIDFTESLQAHETKHFDGTDLFRIPAVPPVLVNCSIINLDYIVHIEVDPSGPSTDLDLRIPVIIGSIPLRSAYQGYSQGPPQVPQGPSPSAPPGEPGAIPPEYADLPPPSYEESVFGRGAVTDENDHEQTVSGPWAPRYPVYGLSQNTLPTAPPLGFEK